MEKTGFFIYTFGCKVNIFESEAIGELLLERGGFFRAEKPSEAGLLIINTCAVTGESEKKALKLIRRARRENPDACILVCGCMTQLSPARVEEAGADIVLGNTERAAVPDAADEWRKRTLRKEKSPLTAVRPHENGERFERLPVRSFAELTRANLKIEDGCDCFCSYCVIPFARGRVRSLPPDEIKKMAEGFVGNGHREIVLTGINIGMYGRDIGRDLCDAVLAVRGSGVPRIRLGSIEIDLVDDDTIRRLSGIPELCPHFHTSLQSGSDTVLRRMNRKYDAAEYLRKIDLLRSCFVNPSVTTDVIVGFPGETEEEFDETASFVSKVGFYKMHVFPYSARPGTAAASMSGQIPEDVKRKRAEKLGAADVKMRSEFIAGQTGIPQKVLVETLKDGCAFGHTENYIYVKIPDPEGVISKNSIVGAEIVGTGDGTAVGKLL